MAHTAEQHRIYSLQMYRNRREKAIDALGGKCVVCCTTQNLELDHIDCKTKEFDISKMWSISFAKYQKELTKCQLLCRYHHIEKTKNERPPAPHGYSRYMNKKYKCRCDICKSAYSHWRRNRYAIKHI